MANSIIIEALDGNRGEDQKIIAAMGCEFVELLLKKNMDYGSSVFKKPVLAPKLEPAIAIQVRMSDKIERLSNLLAGNEQQVQDESLEDTIKDLGAYCLLWLCAKKKQEPVNV